MKLISLKMLNDDFAELTYSKKVSIGWFKSTEKIFTRVIVNTVNMVGTWEFADNGNSIPGLTIPLIIGKAALITKKGETFHFITQQEPQF